jgi:GT2 family glycosyltransferase
MAVASSRARVTVDGKFFRLGAEKFYVKGVAYGPFPPNAAGQPFASPEQTAADFSQIRELGANVVRVYNVPAKWFLDLAAEHDLKVLVDIPWDKQVCFLDSPAYQKSARDAVQRALYACGRHAAIFAYSIANEIPADIVRWSGASAVADFLDQLVLEARKIDPEGLFTFTNYPPTEFLRPECIDFVTFNVYLHQEPAFRKYLARLQMQAETKPLLLGEIGIDSLREGESTQGEMLRWQLENCFRGGLAGAVVFRFTDEWFKDGRLVEDWLMGLTTSDRQPKPAFEAVREVFARAPYFRLDAYPKVSVVVASFNGDRTLKACLDSLIQLNYPDYEVILVDDGSTDTTPQIARAYPAVRYLRHRENLGLSVARNTGIAASIGQIVAFTDSDCRADGDWLHYLVGDLLRSDFAGIGGPNFLPSDDSQVAAAVMVSPGGPAHVMLTDRQAEHIPGCNMAFYKWALEELGGFDPIFRAAGDDVDICWRLQQAGYQIGFSPAAFVWHYRRSTLRAYLKQQQGYGVAEAMLVRKHPEYFNSFGGSIWRGRIYAASNLGVLVRPPVIYRGLFGSGGFQAIYASQPAVTLMLFTTLEYHLLVTLPLWVLSVTFHYLLPLAITSLLASIGVCVAAAWQAALPKSKVSWWSRPLVATLFFLQPIVRGWARYQGRLTLRRNAASTRPTLDSVALQHGHQPLNEVSYWAEERIDRLQWVGDILKRLDRQGWPTRSDIGWSDYDLEIHGSPWSTVQLTTVAEEHPPAKQMIRCRLRPRWSLPAVLGFWVLCGLALLAVGLGLNRFGWWLTLLSVPVLLYAWVLKQQQRTLQSKIVVFLDELAKESKLTKVRKEATPPATPPPTTPKRRADDPFQPRHDPELEMSGKEP